MGFEVKVIQDSVSSGKRRLTTLVATYPRFIHSELLTHRDRARNSASSRAIPFPTMMERICTEPVIPLEWGAEEGGMQMGGKIPFKMQSLAEQIWLEARDAAVHHAARLHHIGKTWCSIPGNLIEEGDRDVRIHKSLPNRITEPWMWITVIMTATEWQNLFRLRVHGDAEIHFQRICGMMRDALENNVPREIADGDWHLPLIYQEDRELVRQRPDLTEEQDELYYLKRISVARNARVSYLTHEGKRDHAKDLELFERLLRGSSFGHFSPFEHVAQAVADPTHRSGPFLGWRQFRKEFALENLAG